MKTLVLQGPFLTRKQAAHSLGLARSEIPVRPDLLRVSGLLEECYFEFQCRSSQMASDVGRVVLVLRGRASDLEIADWFVTQNHNLKEISPLSWIEYGMGVKRVIHAAEAELTTEQARRPC